VIALRIALPGTRVSPLVLALAAILIVLIVPPALFLLNVSLHETRPDGSFGAFTLRFYRELASERLFLSSARNTVLYALGSSAIAIVIGTVQAPIRRAAISHSSLQSSRSAYRISCTSSPGSCCSAEPAQSTTPSISLSDPRTRSTSIRSGAWHSSKALASCR
jgi:ABC-type Fe3+ transport system permease subunit